jgi:transglutaminase-like putative cysteine protease
MNSGSLTLEQAIATTNDINPHHVEWHRIGCINYLIRQSLRYTYPGPVYDLNQRLMLLPPPSYGTQRLLDHRLHISLPDHTLTCQQDSFGNQEINLVIPHIEQQVDFEACILVERCTQNTPHTVPATWLTDLRLLAPSRLTAPDDALRTIASTLLAAGKEHAALAHEISSWTHHALSYAHDITDIHTTASQALALGHGVCQDYAHIMLALCHLCHLPARYVSGHMLGEGGTHAWVEVLVPTPHQPTHATVLAFDPTNDKMADLNYITIAIGRDYYDVAPTSGTFRASYQGTLTAQKRVSLAHLQYLS